MELFNAELTKHVKFGRNQRLRKIIEEVGLGQIVKKVYYRSSDKIMSGQAGVYLCITDTGITIVKDEKEEKIITLYVTTVKELVRAYNGKKGIPTYLTKRVDRNQSKFIKNGKTIWR